MTKMFLPFYNTKTYISNLKSREVLGLEYQYPLNDSLIEMGHSILNTGMVSERSPI